MGSTFNLYFHILCVICTATTLILFFLGITCFIDDACSMALPPEKATGVFVNEDCCLHRDGLSFKLPGNDSQCIHCVGKSVILVFLL